MRISSIRRFVLAMAVPALVIGAAGRANAAVILNFEGQADGTIITTQYQGQGATFSGAKILTAGLSLNEIGFPPHSGTNVVGDYQSGVIQVNAVGGPWSSAGGYITGTVAITLDAYGSSNNLLGSVSTPGANYVGSGTGFMPNIFLQVTAPDIAYVRFHDSGNDFTLDDFTFNPTVAAVPEPTSFVMAGTATLIGLAYTWRRRRHRHCFYVSAER